MSKRKEIYEFAYLFWWYKVGIKIIFQSILERFKGGKVSDGRVR